MIASGQSKKMKMKKEEDEAVEGKGTILRVAAVQMESQNGAIDENLDRARRFVEEAAGRGAKLVLLPEFMPTGYIFTKEIWDAAEPKEGKTVRWLREHAKRLGVHLGTSFLEAEGDDFFNTFVLATPEGREAGRVRKQTPAVFEAYFTKGEAGPHRIDTAIGKLGVGICYENQLAYTPRRLHEQSVDLVLMPHSAPSPARGTFFPRKAVDIYNAKLEALAKHYAELLGVPVVLVNKCGPWRSPLPGLPFHTQDSSFPGFSAIADSDGSLKAQLGAEEGVIVEDVVLDPARKKATGPVCHGRWAMKLPWPMILFRLVEAAGSAWYGLSSERKARARAISSRG